jgi:Fe2+ transport system protein FeoA
MTANSTPFADAAAEPDASREKDGVSSLSLASISIGEEAVVSELALDAELAAWLRAVGIGEGDSVSVLRSGAFGGPLHVRNAVGGEFALNRQLAKSILVKRK